MSTTNFEKLYNNIITESEKFDKKYSIIKENEGGDEEEVETPADTDDVIHQDDEQEENQDDVQALDDDDIQGNQDEQEQDDQDEEIDFSEMTEVTPEEAKKYYEELKNDDDVINNALIAIEQILWKVTGAEDETEIASSPKMQEFKEELNDYCTDEWGIDWSEINDEQEMLFYALQFVVNEKKDLFESEEEWKKWYVCAECESEESQSIIYPTWMQGRGIMDFFLEYFDDDSYEDDDQDQDDEE